ncbi:ABC transporter substrate-binding protein, partial [Streptococcus pseudopneumoniae]|uniref:ABC transporter substrate-binding protein n=1 Tax=Streptococcus pseudopneumoniae TaxID=257758 RepID=UPI00110C2D9C
TREQKVRQALAVVIRVQDLVWQHIGRFAQPTTCLLPPGVLGHDPGRRRTTLTTEEGRKLLDEAGLPETFRLQAAVHPVFQDSYASLLQAIFDVWAEMGVEVAVQTEDMPSFRHSWQDNDGIDLMFTRWAADYDDPDNFTHTHFNSRTGQLRAYFSSDESDELLDEARTE